MYNNNGRQGYQGYNQRYNQGRNNNEETVISKLSATIERSGALSNTLTVEEINLPEKYAYKVSMELKDKMKTNQLRKCFEMIKEAENIEDLKDAKEKLYSVLPLIAYSAGRGLCSKDFYILMSKCISDKALKSKKDVETFIQFMEAVVAYTKYLEEGK